jgi:hypothetical protein
MDPASFPRDLLTDSEGLIVSATLQLKTVCEEIRRIRLCSDLTVDRQDLLRLASLIDDIPSRQDEFTQAQKEYQQDYHKRLLQKTSITPFKPPIELVEGIAICRMSLQALEISTSRASTKLNDDSRLDELDRAAIAERSN